FSPQACAQFAGEMKIDALGVNCGRELALEDYLEILAAYQQSTCLPLFVKPNAGTPRREGDAWLHPRTARQMADWLPALFNAGVRMVGGCCGTTPEHIAAFKMMLEPNSTAPAEHVCEGRARRPC